MMGGEGRSYIEVSCGDIEGVLYLEKLHSVTEAKKIDSVSVMMVIC